MRTRQFIFPSLLLALVFLTGCQTFHDKRAWVEESALNAVLVSGDISTKTAPPAAPVFYSVSDIKKLASCTCAKWKEWQEEERYCVKTKTECTGEGEDRICSTICVEWGTRTITRRRCVRWHTCKED